LDTKQRKHFCHRLSCRWFQAGSNPADTGVVLPTWRYGLLLHWAWPTTANMSEVRSEWRDSQSRRSSHSGHALQQNVPAGKLVHTER
jgi:hypothetical protein